MTEREQPCAECQALAYSGRHEPYLVSDIPERLRFWRCSTCLSLWWENEHDVSVLTETAADALLPRWRTEAAWVQGDLAAALDAFASGTISVETLQIALLHHELWFAPPEPLAAAGSLEVFSSAARAIASGIDTPLRAAAATLLARTAAASIVVDRDGPHPVVLDGQTARDIYAYAVETVPRPPAEGRS